MNDEPDWWAQDESWPGPMEVDLEDAIAAVREMGRAFGKVVSEFGVTMVELQKRILAAYGLPTPIITPVPLEHGRPSIEHLRRKNHGPRGKQTFDRSGRRRY